MGVRSRVTTNMQVPNTVGVNRARAIKDMDSRDMRADREEGENRAQAMRDRGIADIGE